MNTNKMNTNKANINKMNTNKMNNVNRINNVGNANRTNNASNTNKMNKSTYITFPPSEINKVRRIIAIGDLHGDIRATKHALQIANVIDNDLNWIGGDTVVVQVGDQLDRGGRPNTFGDENSEMKIIMMLYELNKKAVLNGGAIYSLIGNHELMNVMGDFTNTSDLGIRGFGGVQKRKYIFRPGGELARVMARTRNVCMKIGDWVFVHAGIMPHISKKYNIQAINQYMRDFLLGNTGLMRSRNFNELYTNDESVLWTRLLSNDKHLPEIQAALNESLANLGAKYMVVGHTVQQDGINHKYNGKLWRIDVAISKAFGDNNYSRIQVLEILDNGREINVLS